MILVKKAEQFIRSLLFRRFQTAELLLALSLFFHGMWLLFPDWTPGGSPTILYRGVELAGAWIMLTSGLIHVPLSLFDWRDKVSYVIRRVLSMWSFIGHAYLLVLVILIAGGTSMFVIPYVTLTLLGALAYLSMSVMRRE